MKENVICVEVIVIQRKDDTVETVKERLDVYERANTTIN